MPMMDQEDTMQGETGMDNSSDTTDSTDTQDEPVSVFLPKAALGGEKCQPGDTLTLKVKDVDPETGDVEAVCQYDKETESEGGMMDDFDKAMPNEE